MIEALYRALYEERTLFQWIHFTEFGVVTGRLSRDLTKKELGIK